MRWAAFAVAAALVLPAMAVAGFDDPAPIASPQQQLDGGLPFPAPYDNVQRDDTPNDPDYDRAEPDLPDPNPSTNVFDERFG